MRWSCPHCGTQLALTEEKIGTGWSFSRCYRCGGFALIRRSELSVIRVDKAPAGENVLLPEATDDPRRSLSAAAARNYAQSLPTPAAPTVRPAGLRSQNPGTSAASLAVPMTIQIAQSTAIAAPSEPLLGTSSRLPEPLPEITPSSSAMIPPAIARRQTRLGTRLLYGGIGVTAIAAVASGAYLFAEGRSLLWSSQRLAGETTRRLAGEASVAVAPAAPIAPASPPSEDVIHVASAKNLIVPASAPAEPSPTFSVRASRAGTQLYSGPGLQFSVSGIANPDVAYPVVGWSNQWFKISVGAGAVAWIRGDSVSQTTR